jgi:hypothetical protein
MNISGPIDWLLILLGIGALGIAGFFIRVYVLKLQVIRCKIHALHAIIDLIDTSIQKDDLTVGEFKVLITKCLELVAELL